jgi:hypothetical protein
VAALARRAPTAGAWPQPTRRDAPLAPQVRYCPQHVVQRKLGVSGRTLGRITGNIWVNDGDSKLDLGLAVKAHGKGLCVPGYTQLTVRCPGGRGGRPGGSAPAPAPRPALRGCPLQVLGGRAAPAACPSALAA